MGQGTLLFDTNSSGSGSSASTAYLADAFNDFATAATNNTGFTSTVTTNPLNQYFANDNSPRYGAKQLWIKDLVLISDRTQWIQDKPTYQVIWNEDFPAAKAYVYGTISLTNTTQGNRLDISRVGDGFGVGGVISRVAWLVETSTSTTATAQILLDNVAGNTIDFSSGATSWDGQPKYNAYVNASSNSAYGLHDYRLVANQANTLSLTGVLVYYEIPGQGINVFGGDSYVNRTQVVSVGSTLSVPSINTVRGGRAYIYKTSGATYGITTTIISDVVSLATGSTNTNLLSLTPGTGASFPAGTAVWIPSGTSNYVGNVLSQSTDTLTMGVTLSFGVSGASIYQLFQAGHTAFPIGSSFTQNFQFDPSIVEYAGVTNNSFTFPGFNDPNLDYRVWGNLVAAEIAVNAWGGSPPINYPGLGASTILDLATTSSFLQVDGNFQALEFEFAAGTSGYLSATLSVDNMAMYTFNDNLAGLSAPGFFRKSIFTNAGPGFHSVRLARAAGHTQVAITRITGYNSKVLNGPSFGTLASLDFGQTFIPQSSISASLSAFGNIKRIFANSIPFKGSWTAGTTLTAAGGAAYYGGSNSVSACSVNFQYYGSAFALLGSIGVSNSLTIDGAGSSCLANTWLGVGLSNTFHKVVLTGSGATIQLEAIDFVRQQGQVKWLNNFSVPYNSNYFETVNNQISVKRQSITTREIQDYSITQMKKAPANVSNSISCGVFTTNSFLGFVNVTGLSTGIVCLGTRPVTCTLMTDGTTGPCFVQNFNGSAYVRAVNNTTNTTLGTYQNYGLGASVTSMNFLQWLDSHPAIGFNSYSIQACTGVSAFATSFFYLQLLVQEL